MLVSTPPTSVLTCTHTHTNTHTHTHTHTVSHTHTHTHTTHTHTQHTHTTHTQHTHTHTQARDVAHTVSRVLLLPHSRLSHHKQILPDLAVVVATLECLLQHSKGLQPRPQVMNQTTVTLLHTQLTCHFFSGRLWLGYSTPLQTERVIESIIHVIN